MASDSLETAIPMIFGQLTSHRQKQSNKFEKNMETPMLLRFAKHSMTLYKPVYGKRLFFEESKQLETVVG
jgi:hypothetical protein